jgi:hypothetical protein
VARVEQAQRQIPALVADEEWAPVTAGGQERLPPARRRAFQDGVGEELAASPPSGPRIVKLTTAARGCRSKAATPRATSSGALSSTSLSSVNTISPFAARIPSLRAAAATFSGSATRCTSGNSSRTISCEPSVDALSIASSSSGA